MALSSHDDNLPDISVVRKPLNEFGLVIERIGLLPVAFHSHE